MKLSHNPPLFVLALGLTLALAACQHHSGPQDVSGATQATLENIETEFWNTLSKNCGTTFVGLSSYPDNADDAFYGKTLAATFESCSATEIRVPFAVGEDRSRTWVFTRTDKGVQLKHQHLHADGTPDEITHYGGLATHGDGAFIHATSSNDLSQISLSFPADAFTQSLIPAAATNVWTITLSSNSKQNYAGLSYYLSRHGKPRFKATLTRVEK